MSGAFKFMFLCKRPEDGPEVDRSFHSRKGPLSINESDGDIHVCELAVVAILIEHLEVMVDSIVIHLGEGGREVRIDCALVVESAVR
jgi:hypothetical protein